MAVLSMNCDESNAMIDEYVNEIDHTNCDVMIDWWLTEIERFQTDSHFSDLVIDERELRKNSRWWYVLMMIDD